MLPLITGFLLIGALLMLQTAVLSNIPLLHGTADLVLLTVIAWALQRRVQTGLHWGVIAGLLAWPISALPFGVTLATYPLAAGLALLLRRRVWQAPLLSMLTATFLATIGIHLLTYGVLRFYGTPLPLADTLNQITLPSLLLNMLLAIPFFAFLRDLAGSLYPEDMDV